MVEDSRGTINAVGWVFGSLCTVVVALRVYARAVIVKKFGWDDGFMVLAWVSSDLNNALILIIGGSCFPLTPRVRIGLCHGYHVAGNIWYDIWIRNACSRLTT